MDINEFNYIWQTQTHTQLSHCLPLSAADYFLFMQKPTYFITTNIFLKAVSFIYFIAFLTAFNDWPSLLGSDGLTPAALYLRRIKGTLPLLLFLENFGNDPYKAFWNTPTLFLFLQPTDANF
jgi:hypothetical protein